MSRIAVLILLLFTTLSFGKVGNLHASGQKKLGHSDSSAHYSQADDDFLIGGRESSNSFSTLSSHKLSKTVYFLLGAKYSLLFVTKDCFEYYLAPFSISYVGELIIFIKVLRI
jgi:hypothetical protein